MLADADWPWRGAIETDLGGGLRRWTARKTSDGSTLDLVEVNFEVAPRLRFELYDQDHHDATPFDDRADYFDTNVATVAKRRNASGDRKVVLACNGLFHGYLRGPGAPPNGYAIHIGLNVSRGVARYNVGSPRWAWGATHIEGRPRFRALLSPTKAQMSEAFDEGAVGAQLLVRDQVALRLTLPGDSAASRVGGPSPTAHDEAGHIREVDFWRTSRVSIGWTADSSKLYFLFVGEPDDELQSKLVARGRRKGPDGGWTLRDLQAFWMSFGIDYAINSDGGMVAQWLVRMPSGRYEFSPPRWVAGSRKMELPEDLSGAPSGGGTLMSFVITEPAQRSDAKR